ncbi:DUF937 domain-containing protein [Diaphorobacter sp. HDW4A]|uniref:DUF937 domain-containing protein n=1 Tax=Diaphorobacter sp. HDW4A TaxID=2714924 RepID=UPI00140A3DB1|nr:DUF937 domain-containing protein [Diaphorobacter sp. HDW4A]QIL79127.1 DUF937 domain-containing protein [Diaphorobacter sp. HDW4A]
MTTNDTSSLAAELMEQLRGAPLQQIAQQLGTSTADADNAVGAALPMLFGALGHNAQQPGGAEALFGALERDHLPAAQGAMGAGGLDLGGLLGSVLGAGAGGAGAGGLGGLLGSVLGGGAGGGGASAGGDILGHIFGANRDRAESGVGQATGLGAGGGQLLQMLAPIVMAFLAQRVSAGGMDSGGLGNMLGQEKSRVQQQGGLGGGLLGSLLDQDGDGQVGIGDLLKMGTSFLGNRR